MTSSFRQLVALYDDKQYKKALRLADALLESNPKDAETVSMRGLILYTMDNSRKDEGLSLAKQGLKLNIGSPTCWHVLGLVHRIDNNLEEAIKCFSHALKLEPENTSLARDLSTMQLRLRQFSGYLRSRRALLLSRNAGRVEWLGYAIAQHLSGQYTWAAQVVARARKRFSRALVETPESAQREQNLDSAESLKVVHYHETRTKLPPGVHADDVRQFWIEDEMETSESIMYEAQLYEEKGDLKSAKEVLEKNAPFIKDYLGRWLVLGRICVLQGDFDAAHKCFLSLLRRTGTDRTALLLATLTHPILRDLVQFPCSTDNKNNSEPYIALSLLGLKSPCCSVANVVDWPMLPIGYIFSSINDTRIPTPDSASWRLLRSLSPEKEAEICSWFIQAEICGPKVPYAQNIVALRFLVDLCSDLKRVEFYLDHLLRPAALKGAPFFVETVRMLLVHDLVKGAIVERLVLGWLSATERGNFPWPLSCKGPAECANWEPASLSEMNPARQMALLTVLSCSAAMVYFHRKDYIKAMEFIDSAKAITPTSPEIYMIKAKILKRLNRLEEAADEIARGRELDLQDRFLNTKTIKYFAQVGRYNELCRMSRFFTAGENAAEKQNLTLQIRKIRCLAASKQWDEALVVANEMSEALEEISKDVYDFHGYALRKGAYRVFIDCLRMKERVWGTKWGLELAAFILSVFSTRITEEKTTESTASYTNFYGEKARNELERICRAIVDADLYDVYGNQVLFRYGHVLNKPLLLARATYRLWLLAGKTRDHPLVAGCVYALQTLDNPLINPVLEDLYWPTVKQAANATLATSGSLESAFGAFAVAETNKDMADQLLRSWPKTSLERLSDKSRLLFLAPPQLRDAFL